MKIIDTFTFYNELDMLYYRLSALYNYVDTFVLVEATLTFKGNPKPLYYTENKDRFQRFADKIVHVVVQDLNPDAQYDEMCKYDDDVWKNEKYQRDCIDCGIKALDMSDDDLILVSDVDEIPNMGQIMRVASVLRENPAEIPNFAVSLEQDFYYYNLTCKVKGVWYFAKICSYYYYRTKCNRSPQHLRMINDFNCVVQGGWHLSYFGNPEFIRNKFLNYSHQEYNTEKYTDIHTINKNIHSKTDMFGMNETLYIPITENRNLPPLCAEFFNSNGEIISPAK